MTTCAVLRTEAGAGHGLAADLVTCGRPLSGTTVCRACTGDVTRWLHQVPSLLDDLSVTLTRQDRVAVPQPGGSGEQPLPFHLRASAAREDLERVLAWWCAELGADGRTAALAGTSAAAGWLEHHATAIAVHPDAAALVEAVREAVTEATDAVDHPRVLLWLGVCHAAVYDVHSTDVVGECLGDLYAETDDATVRCRACGARHDARNRRWALLASAREHQLNSLQLAKACRAYGVNTTAATVRGLARYGHLQPAGTDPAGNPTYRVGDVLDVLRERLERDRAQRQNDTPRRTA